jgi:energy-coupling factor transporter ATP-binding protein EcfA2
MDLTPQAQRRLAIAAAMAARPPMLILDEPTAGQDAAGRDWIARALRIQQTRGAAAVITHDLPFAQRHAGQVVTLARGKVSNIREYRA